MIKIKGRNIKGLAETAHTWQAFEGKIGWKVEISFNAKTGVVWATPMTQNSSLVRSDNGEVFNLSLAFCTLDYIRAATVGYKGKLDYLRAAIGKAIEIYECSLLDGNSER